jgi:hypothetical protein
MLKTLSFKPLSSVNVITFCKRNNIFASAVRCTVFETKSYAIIPVKFLFVFHIGCIRLIPLCDVSSLGLGSAAADGSLNWEGR